MIVYVQKKHGVISDNLRDTNANVKKHKRETGDMQQTDDER